MRLLIACQQCRRQFDASGMAIGERFACSCGEVVEVRTPAGHEAAVVRCSSCGGPREEQATKCRFCEADFTLHERDLHTVCPGCYARVSDKARFCHHCGDHLTPEQLAGDKSSLECPACDDKSKLHGRVLGQGKIHVMECGTCAGFWLGTATFDKLVDNATKAATPPNSPGAAEKRRAASQQPKTGKWRYRRCPVCDDMMVRQNFARASGVIVDLCREHGVWFDIEELPRLLAWVRAGGMQLATERGSRATSDRKTGPMDATAKRARATSFGNAESDGFSGQMLDIGLESIAMAMRGFFR